MTIRMRARAVAPIFVLLVCWLPCSSALGQDNQERLASLLRRARASIGSDRLPRHALIAADGHATRLGVDGAYHLTFSLDGRFSDKTEGPLGETSAFDGHTYWAADSTNVTRKLELGDPETASVPIWVLTGRWLAHGSPLTVSLGPVHAAASDEHSLSLKTKGGQIDATLTISRSSLLPSALRYKTSTGEEKWTFSDYRMSAGLMLPYSFTHTTGPVTDTYTLESATTAMPGAAAAFHRPLGVGSDTRFYDAVAPQVESVRARSGHTLIHPLINGKDVGWFFLDTGAEAMCITPQAAELAAMPKLGRVVVSGVGGATTGSFRKGDMFQLGPVTIERLTYLELDLAFLAPAFTQKIAGVCGYDLFARSIISLRPSTGAVEIYDPARFALRGGRWQELFLHEKNAAVRCKFEGDREEVFRLDTGAGDTVSFHAPAVQRLNLLAGRTTQVSGSGGVGGIVAARQGQIDWFEIGGYRFDKPTVTFSLAETGSFADPYTSGNVGQAFLAPFTVVFDYGRKRVAFVKDGPRSSTAGGGRKL
jgi:hypothetical protein